MRRLLGPRWLAVAAGLLLAVAAGGFLFGPADDTYIFLPNEAHAVDPLVSVEGARPRGDDGGGIYFVDVIVRRASRFEKLVPGIRDGATLVPDQAVNPTGVSESARRRGNLREMTRSQRIAAAVALREAGYAVTARPRGAFVAAVFPETPAAGKLQPSDVIVAVDDTPVRTPADLRRLIRRRPPGTTVEVGIRRGANRLQIPLETAPDPRDGRAAVIGVFVEQDADIRLPLQVKIDSGNVGGPSAGLAFALGVLEELGRDVDHGRKIAVTGEIELDGAVGPVGGILQKVIGARKSDLDVLLVPAGENAEEARRHADGLRVIPVRNFQQALRALATLE